jgi:hypothetical protein
VLDADVRRATSGFARIPAAVVQRVVGDVQRDRESDRWDARQGSQRQLAALDVGLRSIIARPCAHRRDCLG